MVSRSRRAPREFRCEPLPRRRVYETLGRVSAFSPPEVRELISEMRIQARVSELAAQITREYAGRSLVLLSVLKGSFVFTADLARAIALPIRIEFLGVRSYGDDTKSSGVVQITQDLTRPVDGDHILLVEDIVDTGLTLSYLREQLRSRNPASAAQACARPARGRDRLFGFHDRRRVRRRLRPRLRGALPKLVVPGCAGRLAPGLEVTARSPTE